MIKLINSAVGEFSGSVGFHQSKSLDNNSDYSGSGSLLAPLSRMSDEWPNIVFDEPIRVECVNLEDWSKINNVQRIDLIWMDAQGAELSILRGAGTLLNVVNAIILEVWSEEYYKGSGTQDEIVDFMHGYGFRPTHSWLDGMSGDVLFEKR